MRRFLGWTAVFVMAVALAGCTSASKSSMPCESCKWGAKNTQGPMNEPMKYCVVNGQKVDCTKTPPECPECAKAVQK